MPSYVITEKCDGCKGQDRTDCMYICPNDLMILDKEAMKAHNRDPQMCWECMCCVKLCPQQAMAVLRLRRTTLPVRALTVFRRGCTSSTTSHMIMVMDR